MIKNKHFLENENEAHEIFTIYDVLKEAIRKNVSYIHFNSTKDFYYTFFVISDRMVLQQHFTMNIEKAEMFFDEVRHRMFENGGFKLEKYFPELGVVLRGELIPKYTPGKNNEQLFYGVCSIESKQEYTMNAYDKKYRIDLTQKEYKELISLCDGLIDSTGEIKQSLWEKISSPKEIRISEKKREVASRMASVRWKDAKAQAAFDAISQLKKEGAEITPTTVSKRAEIHYATAKKYIAKYHLKKKKE